VKPARIDEEFPAPSYRGNQREALADIEDAFAAGNEVVLVRAPTGSGKSLLSRAIMGCARRDGEGDPGAPTGAYYTTPQVSQLEDVAEDGLLEDLAVIRGKPNYDCVLPGERDTRVDRAPCARERGFDCPEKHRCPYFADRASAAKSDMAAMTLAYFMQTAGSEVFGERNVLVVDEAHGLAEWAEMYATIDLRPETVPLWDDRPAPAIEDLRDAVEYAEGLAVMATRRLEELRSKLELAPEEAGERDRLTELVSELEWFAEDARDHDSPTTWVVDQPDGEGTPVTIKPMNPERYLQHTVWDRAERFALLSATILEKESFCRAVGLSPDDVALVEVGHTFPLEHRPLYDVTRGKMTYEHRDETIPAVARLLVRLMARHPDEKGLVHAHSYAIQERLADLLWDFGVGARVRSHDRDDRDRQLESWTASTDPELFLSVKMEEALDLHGDHCRWQVLCKAPYPNTRDSRVAHRLQKGQWGWYYRSTLRTVIQACGRVVRSPDDRGATYLADTSLLDCFERARGAMPPWFADRVDAMTRPDLPAFDPDGALAGIDAAPGDAGPTRSARSPSSRPSGDSGSARSGTRRSSGTVTPADDSRTHDSTAEDHPLSDVWE